MNKKYHDPLFRLPYTECLTSLKGLYLDEKPASMLQNVGVQAAKRVGEIFNNPQFVIDGATASDVKQGSLGDCWFLAAVTSLSGVPKLLERLCVERDEQVGVYGFCFFRDGQWIYEVVDDRLCVKYPENPQLYLLQVFGDSWVGSSGWDNMNWERLPKEMLQKLLKGQRTLFFSSCKEGEETWLPLMEKAYAKAHGDYQTIEGGFTGEGIEDLTGGVNVSLFSEDILDKDRLWEELKQVNKAFLFGCGSFRKEAESEESIDHGLVTSHAYTVLEAREVNMDGGKKERLIKIRNPWGSQEWRGAWSDGSEEWTPEMMKTLNHRFGNDGIFWISFQDWMKNYQFFDRTRLFGNEWIVAQQWSTVEIPQSVNYLDTVSAKFRLNHLFQLVIMTCAEQEYITTKFSIKVEEKGPVVLVLAKPDERYFDGLEGRFSYDLHFRLYRDGEESYLVRSMEKNASGRSCSAELDLDPGTYTLRMKISPERYDDSSTPGEVIEQLRSKDEKWITEKILAVGKSFDAANSKASLRETELSITKKVKRDTKKSEHDEKKRKRDKLREGRRRKHLRSERIRGEEERKKAAKVAAKRSRKQTLDTDSKREEASSEKLKASESREESEETVTATDEAGSKESKPADDQHPQSDDSNGFEKVDAKSSDDAKGAKQGVEGTKQEAPPAKAEEPEPELAPKKEESTEDRGCSDEDVSDISSIVDEDFEWDSEIDGSVEDSEEEDPAGDKKTDDDPWRALCVVGLRVYSSSCKTKLEVVD